MIGIATTKKDQKKIVLNKPNIILYYLASDKSDSPEKNTVLFKNTVSPSDDRREILHSLLTGLYPSQWIQAKNIYYLPTILGFYDYKKLMISSSESVKDLNEVFDETIPATDTARISQWMEKNQSSFFIFQETETLPETIKKDKNTLVVTVSEKQNTLRFYHPSLPSKTIQTAITLLDITPTILVLTNIPPPQNIEGQDVTGFFNGKTFERLLFTELSSQKGVTLQFGKLFYSESQNENNGGKNPEITAFKEKMQKARDTNSGKTIQLPEQIFEYP